MTSKEFSHNPTERRQHSRYPAHHLDVLIQLDGNEELPWALAELVAVDFNQFGIAVESAHAFGIGDHLSLVICTDDRMTAHVKGIVCNRTPCVSGFRYGLYFDYSKNEGSGKERHILVDIEQILK